MSTIYTLIDFKKASALFNYEKLLIISLIQITL